MVGSFGTTASLTYLFDVFHDFSPPPASHTSTRIPNSMHNDNSPYMLSVLMPAMSLAFGFVSPSPSVFRFFSLGIKVLTTSLTL